MSVVEQVVDSSGSFVPVYRPRLPKAESVAGYLAQLDASRLYTNHGDLSALLESRLAAAFSIATGGVIGAASGTAALTGAILAAAGRATAKRPLCLCPGYTFVAAPLAAELCGYRMHLVDVDEAAWVMEPDVLAAHPLLDRVGVILVAAPYGRRLAQTAWVRLSQQTGIPVVIDAAASFEALADDAKSLIGSIPIVLSFHATKAFSTGEGGAIVSTDPAMARAAMAALNFGFDGVRETTGPGFNGKMSEYQAAVGLAELDGWAEKCAAFRRVAETYREFAESKGLRLHVAPAVSSNYVLFEAASERSAGAAQVALGCAGFDHRLWYGRGLHREAYFRHVSRDVLPGVEALAPRLIGLPMAPDLSEGVVERIVAALAATQTQ